MVAVGLEVPSLVLSDELVYTVGILHWSKLLYAYRINACKP